MEMIGTRIDPKMVEILQEIAEEEHRPMGNLLRLIIMDWLEYRKGIKIVVGTDGRIKEPKK